MQPTSWFRYLEPTSTPAAPARPRPQNCPTPQHGSANQPKKGNKAPISTLSFVVIVPDQQDLLLVFAGPFYAGVPRFPGTYLPRAPNSSRYLHHTTTTKHPTKVPHPLPKALSGQAHSQGHARRVTRDLTQPALYGKICIPSFTIQIPNILVYQHITLSLKDTVPPNARIICLTYLHHQEVKHLAVVKPNDTKACMRKKQQVSSNANLT